MCIRDSVNAVPAVEKLIGKVEGDEKTGVKIIVNALQEPVRQIAKNAGVDGSVVLEKIKSSRKVGYGFDAYKEVYCDMIGAGIVDPAKVTRSALANAASVSSMVLTLSLIHIYGLLRHAALLSDLLQLFAKGHFPVPPFLSVWLSYRPCRVFSTNLRLRFAFFACPARNFNVTLPAGGAFGAFP